MGQTETSAIFAGTGLNIDIDVVKKEKRKRKDDNIFNQLEREKLTEGDAEGGNPQPKRDAKSKSERNKEKLGKIIPRKEKDKSGRKNEDDDDVVIVEGAEKKRLMMMERAKALSRKIAGLDSPSLSEDRKSGTRPQPSQTVSEPEKTKAKSEKGSLVAPTDDSAEKDKLREKERRRKKRRHKGAHFEGKRIKGLKKWEPYKRPKTEDGEDGDDDDENVVDVAGSSSNRDKSAAQDEYVLAKLFKKSGVHSALRHDAIVDSGAPDYAIVESEAKKVAAEAAARLKVGMDQIYVSTDELENPLTHIVFQPDFQNIICILQ